MLKQGAGLFTSVKDMLEETGLASGAGQVDGRKGCPLGCHKEPAFQNKADKTVQKVWDALDFYPKDIDCLMEETQMDYRVLVRILSGLCLEEKAVRLTAGQFMKKI